MDKSEPAIGSGITLPLVDVVKAPIYIEMDSPAHGAVRSRMTVTYTIHNRTPFVQDMRLTYESSDAFMYAGNKQIHFKILPRDVYKLTYNLYPLQPGYAVLPHLRLLLNPEHSNQVSLDELVKDMVPSHIFVMPHGRKSIGEISVPA